MNRSKLKGRSIFISADLTLKQRAAEKRVREELLRLKSEGETNLTLKYVQGIPRITAKKKLSHNASGLAIYYQNVRGTRTKLGLLQNNLVDFNYDILVLTETWLSDEIFDAELGMFAYTVYRKDRSSVTSSYKRGGGVLIAVRKNIFSQRLHSSEEIEQLFVSVGTGSNTYVIGAVYVPPRSSTNVYISVSENVDKLAEELPDAKIVILGDFNLPNAKWVSDNFSSTATSNRGAPLCEVESTEVLSNMCAFYNMFQNNDVHNENNSVLDLVLSQSNTSVFPAEEALLPPDAHHPPISSFLEFQSNENNPGFYGEEYYRDFKSADYNSINEYLSYIDWDNLFANKSLDDIMNDFYNCLFRVMDMFVPLKKSSSRKFPLWFTPALKNMVFRKKMAHSNFKMSGLHSDYLEFTRLRSICKQLARECYHNYVSEIENNIPHNIKSFWKFVKSKRRSSDIPYEVSHNDVKCDTGPEVVNLFADYFSSIYCDTECDVTSQPSINCTNISFIDISISEIYLKLDSLDCNKGPGPDGIPPSLLKHCSFILARPLFIIFNASLKTGYLPFCWKTSFIIPIHKSGSKSEVRNYRPVSNLNAIPKVLENIITEHLTAALGGSIIDQQFGFQSGKSTELNLVLYVDFISDALESGSEVHSIYTDFSKAFDRVHHGVLLSKLEACGVTGWLLEWFRSYLTDRTQIVRVHNFKSNPIQVTSGVPQGSHIGPLLFNLFVNDIQVCFPSCKFLLFADDLKLFTKVSDLLDCECLQIELNNLVIWCKQNGMELNSSKCHAMTFSRATNPLLFQYKIEDHILENVSKIKDLGVTMDRSLSFIPHISSITASALKMLGFIKRSTTDFQNTSAIKNLFCSLVRPLLEYASSVWNPYYAVHIDQIDRVQHKFLRYISFKINNGDISTYKALETVLNLSSLETRRRHHDLQLLYNILNSIYHSPDLLSRIGLFVAPRTTRSNCSFYQPVHRTNYGQNSFITRSTRLANAHSVDLDFFMSPSKFLHDLKSKVK